LGAAPRTDPLGELLHAARVLDRAGFLPACDGNLSARADEKHILITRSSVEKRALTEVDFVTLSLDCESAPGASSEWPMHRALYRARGDVNSVIHVHSPCLTAFACAHRAPSVNLLAESCALVGPIVLVDYRPPGSEELAQALLSADANTGVYLLANHGAVAVGASVREALYRLERAEFLAHVEWLAAALGGGVPLNAASIRELQRGRSDRC
jgi:L-fuculose-phosphate aldolase